MIYATLQNRQEAEFGMSTTDNFTTAIFSGKDIVACEMLDEFIRDIDKMLIGNYEEELAYINEKIELLQGIKVSFVDKATLFLERLKLRMGRKRLEELLSDSSEEREVQYLKAFRYLGFERRKMYEYPDGTMVQEFQLDADVKTLNVGITELKAYFKDAIKREQQHWKKKYNFSLLTKMGYAEDTQ